MWASVWPQTLAGFSISLALGCWDVSETRADWRRAEPRPGSVASSVSAVPPAAWPAAGLAAFWGRLVDGEEGRGAGAPSALSVGV